MSYKYYDDHAEEYYESSFNANMSETMERFLHYVPKGATILDAGSGTGRDTKTLLDLGYTVKAFDASIEMVKMSALYTGIETLHAKFEEIEYCDEFDGIWACASLLHVDRHSLDHVFFLLKKALKKDGILYCSFKSREKDYIKDGRHFTCFTNENLAKYLEGINQFSIIEIWDSRDVREDRKSEVWVNCILKNGSQVTKK